MTELLNCPFCGFQPVLDDPDFLYPITRERDLWGAHCPEPAGGCSASILGASKEEALNNWNRRAAASAQAKQKAQEPVAWMTYSALTGEPQFTKEQTSELASVPLYAAPSPAAREAGDGVRLTDEPVKCELCNGVGQIGSPGQRCFACDGSGNSKHQGLYQLAEGLDLSTRLTPYGMLVRALRIVAGTTLYDMAKYLTCSSAMLSGVEFGRKPLTDAMVAETAAYFSSLGIHDTLHALIAAHLREAGSR